MDSSITEGSLLSTGTGGPREEIAKISPVRPVQYCDVPAPSVPGPVAQLDVPTGPPVPASVTTRPARVSTRCLGALSPPCTTVSWMPAVVASATAGTAAVPASAASITAAAVAVRRILVPFAPDFHTVTCYATAHPTNSEPANVDGRVHDRDPEGLLVLTVG